MLIFTQKWFLDHVILFFFHTWWVGWVGFGKYGKFHIIFLKASLIFSIFWKKLLFKQIFASKDAIFDCEIEWSCNMHNFSSIYIILALTCFICVYVAILCHLEQKNWKWKMTIIDPLRNWNVRLFLPFPDMYLYMFIEYEYLHNIFI